jgi:hypothetical protein
MDLAEYFPSHDTGSGNPIYSSPDMDHLLDNELHSLDSTWTSFILEEVHNSSEHENIALYTPQSSEHQQFPLSTSHTLPNTMPDMSDSVLADLGYAPICAYKPIAKKVCPILGMMPDDCKTVRWFPEDPLLTVPLLDIDPPLWTDGDQVTRE